MYNSGTTMGSKKADGRGRGVQTVTTKKINDESYETYKKERS